MRNAQYVIAIVIVGLVVGCDAVGPSLLSQSAVVDVAPCSADSAPALDQCIHNTPLGSTRANSITLTADISDLRPIDLNLASSCTCGDPGCKPVRIDGQGHTIRRATFGSPGHPASCYLLTNVHVEGDASHTPARISITNGSHDVTIKNSTFDGVQEAWGAMIDSDRDTSDVSVSANTFHQCGNSGKGGRGGNSQHCIEIGGSNYQVLNNRFQPCGDCTYLQVSGDGVDIEGNTFEYNTRGTCQLRCVQGTGAAPVDDAHCSNVGNNGLQPTSGYWCAQWDGSPGSKGGSSDFFGDFFCCNHNDQIFYAQGQGGIIRRNVFETFDNGSAQLFFKGGGNITDTVVENNLFLAGSPYQGSTMSGKSIWFQDAGGSTDVVVRHNTILTGDLGSIRVDGGAPNIYNNVVLAKGTLVGRGEWDGNVMVDGSAFGTNVPPTPAGASDSNLIDAAAANHPTGDQDLFHADAYRPIHQGNAAPFYDRGAVELPLGGGPDNTRPDRPALTCLAHNAHGVRLAIRHTGCGGFAGIAQYEITAAAFPAGHPPETFVVENAASQAIRCSSASVQTVEVNIGRPDAPPIPVAGIAPSLELASGTAYTWRVAARDLAGNTTQSTTVACGTR